MLNKFAALVAVATMMTVGLQATETCTEVKTTVEQKKVATTTEDTSKEETQVKADETTKTPALAACGERCNTTVEEEEVVTEETV